MSKFTKIDQANPWNAVLNKPNQFENLMICFITPRGVIGVITFCFSPRLFQCHIMCAVCSFSNNIP